MRADLATPLRIGANVETFTRRTGRITDLLPGKRVVVNVLLRPRGGDASPVWCPVIYLASDVKVPDSLSHEGA